MVDLRSPDEWKRIWRYYQAGVVNTLFGYGAYAALVALGLNMFLAQVISHLLGMTFNYITYSRYAFRGHSASIARFIASYAVNYILSVAVLAAAAAAGLSPYLAGLAAIVVVSAINYFLLAELVYQKRGAV